MKSFAPDLDALLAVAAAVLDANGVLVEANAGFLRLLPAEGPQPIGARAARFFVRPTFEELMALESDGRVGYRGLMTIGDSAGKSRTLRGSAWRSGTGLRVLAEYDVAELERLNDAMLDINRESAVAQNNLAGANFQLKQREVRILEVSLTDALTGLGNRRKLDQSLAIEIKRVRREGGPLSAIMSDIDHFKRVNDELGHGTGDKVLSHLGALVRSSIRATDIAARFGGEEFVVLMPHTGVAQAAAKAEQFRVALAAETIAPMAKPVTCSYGVAELLPGEDAAAFLGRVDAALYRAKAGGRNRVVVAGSE